MKKVDFQSEKQLKDGTKKEAESHPQSLKFDSKKQPINYLGQENQAPSSKQKIKLDTQGTKVPQQKVTSNKTTPRTQIKQQGKTSFLNKEPTQTEDDYSDSDYSIESQEDLIPKRYPQIKILPKKRKRKDMSLFFEHNVLDQNRIRKINFVKSSSETSSDTEEDEYFPQRGQNRGGPIIIAPSFDPMVEYSKHGQSIDPYKSVQFSQKSVNPVVGQKSVMQTQKSIMQSQKSIAQQGTVRSIAPPPSQKQYNNNTFNIYGSTSKQQAGSVKQSTVKSAKQSVAKSVKLPPPELSRYIEPQKQEEWAKYETPPVVDPYVIQKPSQAPPPNNPQKPLYRIPKPRQEPKKQDIGFQKQEYKSAGVKQPKQKIIEEQESDSDSYCDCCA